jgi:type I restriction enzyme M protein
MIALPGQLFYTTQIPICLWFLTKNKKADNVRGYRNREGETLFIDAHKIGSMINRTQKELLIGGHRGYRQNLPRMAW